MNRLNITTLFLVCMMVALVGCLDNTGSDPEPVVEPAGSADYYINNQSSVDFSIIYTKKGAQVADTFQTVTVDSSTKFLRDGHYGNNPSPSTSFTKIEFYEGDPDTSMPIFTIDPVVDDAWSIIEEKGFEDYELGFRVYELVITEEDLK